ncbi:hypothetical protein MARA_18480 [Mycolicibacterium arabiense]|uniref:Uncharacterized protein n=1 Tax=Mycolicibacterium arabiense TaxID=1286181 RepID=A0A7I7RW18_9MYCO|nr:hypothetical protein [Mycolicibacterium arabiense]MCV7375235.1 hypothetical protein [Mycolicibacterium arabiense]BBY48380.1 hypothetical protein MARA_18480 [Mycolicibacterium arabiense]
MPNQDRSNATPVRADDALKYAVALLKAGTSEFDTQAQRLILDLAAQLGDGERRFDDEHYSDGRLVETTVDIAPAGSGTAHHVWHPDPAAEQPDSSVTNLGDDAFGRSSGFFEVTTDPATQELRAYLVRLR